jgi:heme-degrading monooxygenase HmoA
LVFRLRAPCGQAAFRRAWCQAMRAIRAADAGCLGGELLQSARDPDELAIVTRWESLEAWRAFWAKGPPEPQGDPARNEVFVEIDRVDAAPPPDKVT